MLPSALRYVGDDPRCRALDRWLRVRLVAFGAALFLSGCTFTGERVSEPLAGDGRDAPSAVGSPPPATSSDSEHYWWSVGVRMGFDEEKPVRWHLDALLADRVFAPLIERHSAGLQAWRFHRRAAPDKAGHTFAFLFYATDVTARAITDELSLSAVLSKLRRVALIEEVITPKQGQSLGAALSATSDATWSPVVQETWPWFIQGVSQHWLALIQKVGAVQADPPEDVSVAQMEDRYRNINESVTALWFQHGQHAYLHHLNALFGYQPLLLQERRGVRF